MRNLVALLLLLVPMVGYPCSLVEIEDPWCEQNPEACARRDLRVLYEQVDVAYEVTVQSVSHPWPNFDRRSFNQVKVEHVWKSDGGPIDELAAGLGGGDCTIALQAGARYVVFAFRIKSAWSFLPWVGEPLYAGMTRTFKPEEFKQLSPAHAALYNTRTAQQLKKVLAELR